MKKITQQLFYRLLFIAILCCSFVSLNAQAPKVNSIVRQNPTDATTDANEVTFRVTFSDNVLNVTTDDFVLSGTSAADGTVSLVTKISNSVYDVKVTGIDNSSGTINLDIKGVDGAGTNNIIKDNSTLDISNTPTAQLTDSFTFGQSFLAVKSGSLVSITLSKYPGLHTASGSGTLNLYSGAGFGGTLLASQNITVTNASGEESYSFDTPASIVAGNTYTFRVNYSGSGDSAFHAQTGNTYPNGDIYHPAILSGADLYFKIYTSSGVGESLLNTLPATDQSYTIINLPLLTTADANSITINSAALGGTITSNNGFAITERGVVYSSTDTTPEIGETGVTKDTNGTGTGVFSETISGLTNNTTYYYRAYAINSTGTGYGTVKSFTTLKDYPEVVSIERQNPTNQNLSKSSATFRVTFDKAVNNVDTSDFSTNSPGASISNVSVISASIYDVTVNNINKSGDVYLLIKGVDGASGTNDITFTTAPTTTSNTTVDQQTQNDYLNQSTIGQTFTAATNGIVKSVTFYPRAGQHTFSGTADLKLYSGVSNNGGTEIDSESVSITNSTVSAGQTLTFATPVTLTQGNTYTLTLENFNGSGNHALNSNTNGGYSGGQVIFTGMNSSSHLNFDLQIKIIEEFTGLENLALASKAPTTNENYLKLDILGRALITTTSATNITNSSASLGGEVVQQGNSTVTERGIVYSTTSSFPEIGKTGVVKEVIGSGTGTYTSTVTGLETKNIYFYRAYATNSQGTAYGSVKKFSLNNALHLDGSNDYTEIPNYNYTNGFSFDALIKPESFSGNPTFLSRYSANNEVFAFIITSSGAVECTISTNGTTDTYFTTTSTLTAGAWQHVAFSYNNADGAMKFYINGVDAGGGSVTNATTGSLFNSTSTIQIGARDSGLHYQGAVDELRIWNKTLSETFINQIKNKVVPANADGLLAYYQFNQGITNGDNSSISQLYEKKSNTLVGSLLNFNKNGTTSNFIAGASGDFDNTQIAQNKFATTGNWSNSNNWSLGVVPNKVDRVIIGSNQTVTIDVDDLEIDDFELEANATLNIPTNKEITINNAFKSSGNLTLNSDKTDSGVLLIKGTTSGNVTYTRGGLLANDWYVVTPPISGQTIKSFAENNANDIRVNTTPNPNRYAIAYYDDSQASGSKWRYYDAGVNNTDVFVAGQSYSMSRASNGSFTFTGTLTVDDLSKTLTAGQWNAIGNPFTTYYPANKNSSTSFLNDNMSKIDTNFPALYIWDDTQDKYVAVTELDAANRSLPPGQGFFIKMKTGVTDIIFNEEKRSTKPATGTTDFSKTATTPEITLHLKKNKTDVTTSIKFFKNATNGFDAGYDIGNFDSSSLDIYSHLVDNSNANNYTIQSLSNSSFDGVTVPISIVAKKGDQVNLSGLMTNLPEEIKLFVEDRVENTFTELTSASTKEFIVENDGEIKNRFYIHLSQKSLSTNNFDVNALTIYTYNNNLFIHNVKEDTSLQLFSVDGKSILSKKITASDKTIIQLPKVATGIYIASLKTKSGKVAKKIIIE